MKKNWLILVLAILAFARVAMAEETISDKARCFKSGGTVWDEDATMPRCTCPENMDHATTARVCSERIPRCDYCVAKGRRDDVRIVEREKKVDSGECQRACEESKAIWNSHVPAEERCVPNPEQLRAGYKPSRCGLVEPPRSEKPDPMVACQAVCEAQGAIARWNFSADLLMETDGVIHYCEPRDLSRFEVVPGNGCAVRAKELAPIHLPSNAMDVNMELCRRTNGIPQTNGCVCDGELEPGQWSCFEERRLNVGLSLQGFTLPGDLNQKGLKIKAGLDLGLALVSSGGPDSLEYLVVGSLLWTGKGQSTPDSPLGTALAAYVGFVGSGEIYNLFDGQWAPILGARVDWISLSRSMKAIGVLVGGDIQAFRFRWKTPFGACYGSLLGISVVNIFPDELAVFRFSTGALCVY